MGISQVSSSNPALSFQAEANAKAVRTAREEQSRVGKSFTGRSKAEEEKATQAAAQAAGVGAGSLQQTLVEGQKKVEKNLQVGAVASPGGAPRPTAAKTTDQAVKAIAARGGDETSFKVQQQRQDRLAGEVQKTKAAADTRVEIQQNDSRQARIIQTAAYQRSDAANLQTTRAKLAEQAEASKGQNVQVKQVESVDPKQVAAKVQNEQVQRNQEVAQTDRVNKNTAAQLKIQVTDNAEKLKQTQQGPSEATKVRNTPVPPSPVGQKINIKA